MADWGFQDMATAEAYLKRQQRQLQGARKKHAEAVVRSPEYRLQKIKQQVRWAWNSGVGRAALEG